MGKGASKDWNSGGWGAGAAKAAGWDSGNTNKVPWDSGAGDTKGMKGGKASKGYGAQPSGPIMPAGAIMPGAIMPGAIMPGLAQAIMPGAIMPGRNAQGSITQLAEMRI